MPDGSFKLAFPTLFNRVYSIQYTDDLRIWLTALHTVIGTGATVEWTDAGPPETVSAPQTAAQRLYRILLTP